MTKSQLMILCIVEGIVILGLLFAYLFTRETLSEAIEEIDDLEDQLESKLKKKGNLTKKNWEEDFPLSDNAELEVPKTPKTNKEGVEL